MRILNRGRGIEFARLTKWKEAKGLKRDQQNISINYTGQICEARARSSGLNYFGRESKNRNRSTEMHVEVIARRGY
jgi:hypothetical protein